MAVLPPGYHLKCNFCEKTEGPISTEELVKSFLESKDNQWMEIHAAGEVLHCCGATHFEYPASEAIEKLFADDEEKDPYWKARVRQELLERQINRGF